MGKWQIDAVFEPPVGILRAAAAGDCAGVIDACAEREELEPMLTDLEAHIRTMRRCGDATAALRTAPPGR